MSYFASLLDAGRGGAIAKNSFKENSVHRTALQLLIVPSMGGYESTGIAAPSVDNKPSSGQVWRKATFTTPLQ